MSWFSSLTPDIEKKMRQDHEKKVREFQEQQDALEKENKTKIKERMLQKQQEETARIEEEVTLEARKGLESLQQDMDALEAQKVQNKMTLDTWKAAFPEQMRQMKVEMEEKGEAEIEKRKVVCGEKEEKLDKIRGELKEMQEALLKALSDKSDKLKQCRETQEAVFRSMNAQHDEFINDRTDKLFALEERRAADEKKMFEKEKEDGERRRKIEDEQNLSRLNQINGVVNAVKADDNTDKFKHQVDAVIRQHGHFAQLYANVERTIRTSTYDMEKGEKLTTPPNIDDVSDALDAFLQTVSNVHMKLPKEQKHLDSTCRDVKDKVEEVKRALHVAHNSTKTYRKTLKVARRSQRSGSSDTQSNQSAPLFVNTEYPKIKEHFVALQKAVKELEELVQKFHVESPNQLATYLGETLKLQSTSSNRAALRDEPSTSDAHQESSEQSEDEDDS